MALQNNLVAFNLFPSDVCCGRGKLLDAPGTQIGLLLYKAALPLWGVGPASRRTPPNPQSSRPQMGSFSFRAAWRCWGTRIQCRPAGQGRPAPSPAGASAHPGFLTLPPSTQSPEHPHTTRAGPPGAACPSLLRGEDLVRVSVPSLGVTVSETSGTPARLQALSRPPVPAPRAP